MNLDAFFNPKCIAVIGASRSPEKLGYLILENLKVTFQGKIYPINPNASEILGLACLPSILDIEDIIPDMAIIAVPAAEVKKVLSDCIKKKIKAAVIITSGFSEIGNKEAELELKNMAKGKIRLIGPNCVGIYQKGLDMLFFPRKRLKRPSEGSIAFITQSGAFGSTLLDLVASEGVGVSKFISIGNKIDVNETELLEYLSKDLNTRCIAMYIESIEDGKNFIEVAKRVVKKKPIVVFKAGKTNKGKEAILSHTGSLAGEHAVYSAAFEQAGIIEANTTEELFDFAKALANQPVMNSNKIAIVTNGGGFGIVATDEAVRIGLEVPELSKESIKNLEKFMPAYATKKNPVDLTGDATTERYEKALSVVFKEKEIAGVVCIGLMQIPTLKEDIINVLRECKVYGKPMTICATGGQWTTEKTKILESYGIPVYLMPERAVKSIKALYDYGKILKMK